MIVHVLGQMMAGGNERLCLELIRRGPPGRRHVLLTIGPRPDGALEPLFRAIPGLKLVHEPYSSQARLAFTWRLARRLWRLRPRGIVAYSFGLHVLVAVAAKLIPGCRVLSHVGNPPPASGRLRSLFKRLVQISRLLGVPLWSCSHSVHDGLCALGATLPRGSLAMPNGIDVGALRIAAQQGKASRPTNAPVIGMIARLDVIKDQGALLRAFCRVRQAQPQAQLWLAGDGDRREQLEDLAAALDLQDAVRFLGVRRDIGELLGQIDVFAFSTTAAEGFGIALAEAMAVGLPIVATDVPACREVLGDGACGVLVPVADDAAMAEQILWLLDHPNEADRLGRAAAAHAEAAYDIEACARAYYGHLLGPAR